MDLETTDMLGPTLNGPVAPEGGSTEPIQKLPPTRLRMRIMGSLLVLLLLAAGLLAIASHKVRFEKVISGSMEPNLMIGDVILVDANAFPGRYDVVCLKNPENAEETLVKRVIGLPGDRILIQDGILYLNGEEEYSRHVSTNQLAWRDARIAVPENSLFVLGDNRNNSYDSLNFGSVSYAHVLGTVNWIIRPLSRFGRVQALHDPPAQASAGKPGQTDTATAR